MVRFQWAAGAAFYAWAVWALTMQRGAPDMIFVGGAVGLGTLMIGLGALLAEARRIGKAVGVPPRLPLFRAKRAIESIFEMDGTIPRGFPPPARSSPYEREIVACRKCGEMAAFRDGTCFDCGATRNGMRV